MDIPKSEYLVVLLVPHEDTLSGDITTVLTALNRFRDSRETVLISRSRITLLFDGYDNDPRDLYYIPEVRSYVATLDKAFPYWFYFANLADDTLKLLMFCLCRVITIGPSSTPDTNDIMQFIREHTLALNQLCDEFELGDDSKTSITKEALNYLVPPDAPTHGAN